MSRIVVQNPDDSIALAQDGDSAAGNHERRRLLRENINEARSIQRNLNDIDGFFADITEDDPRTQTLITNPLTHEYYRFLERRNGGELIFYNQVLQLRRQERERLAELMRERESLLPQIDSVTIRPRSPVVTRLNVYRAQSFRNRDTTQIV